MTAARTAVDVAKVEAALLVRNVLMLAGLLAGGVLIWILIHLVEPLWWNTTWEIGDGQLVLGMAVLVAAQLATGRARRDGMANLYASFPATAGTRTVGQLVGLAGAVPASLVLIGAATVAVQLIGAIGAPSITVLAGGMLLVIASGAAGIAIGTRFPHPLAGVLGALVSFVVSLEFSRFSGAVLWLMPWEFHQDDLGYLPGPLAGYPPAGAHAAELAAIAVLAGIVALAVTARRGWVRAGLATGGLLAVAVICLAGAAQLRPVSTAGLNRLVAEAANPASVQRCTTANQVNYCLDPGFGSLLPSLEAPVNGVLAHVPAQPGPTGLTISQVGTKFLDSTLTHGHPRRQVAQWEAELERSPAIVSPASAIFFPVGAWPAFGEPLADAYFNIALGTAEWAVHIPLAMISPQQCVPFNQAREPIAIWLAILATHPPAAELQAGLPAHGFFGTYVHNIFVPIWSYPGGDAGQVDQFGSGQPQITEVGYLLARAMTNLPEHRVAHVLKDGWGRWISVRTTDAQLAAALGIQMPSVSVPQIPTTSPPGVTTNQGPESPVCR